MTLSQKLEQAATAAFRYSIYQRMVDGETIQVGDSRIYLNGCKIEERAITAADMEAVKRARA